MDRGRGAKQGPTELERQLLEAARSDRPPEALAAHMARALRGGAAAAPDGNAAKSGASAGGKFVAPLFAKAALWGTLSIGLALFGAVGVQLGVGLRAAPQVQDAHARSETTASPDDEAPRTATVAATHTASGEALPTPTLKAPAKSARVQAPEATAREATANHDPLLQEVALLGRVRSALQQQRSARALRLLSQYTKHFRGGTLAPEAAVLRIEVLLQQGEYQAAVTSSEQFVNTYPAHPLRARAQALVASRAAR